MEYKEFSDVEEQDYDIKSSFSSNEEENNIYDNFQLDDWEIEEDIFENQNIEDTLKRYNYDYKALMRELTTFIDYSRLLEILNECGITKEEYLNPTYVTFEKVRDKIINNGVKK